MSVKIQLRRGTSQQWYDANTLLAAGEPGIEIDTGKIKYGDGSALWRQLPYYADRIDINDLGDVVISAPSTGQVLKYDGTNWVNGIDATGGGIGGGSTYAISAEVTTGGANLRLTGSDTTTDNVKFAAGANVTVTRTDGNTITIASTAAGSTIVQDDTTPKLGGNLDLNGFTIKRNTQNLIALNGNDLNLTPVGIVNLPAGSKVGGVIIGSLNIKGAVANYTALVAIVSKLSGDAYIVSSPTPSHMWVWNGTAWTDLGEFQGPSGSGVRVGGTVGQVLSKASTTDYDTIWTTPSYTSLTDKPTFGLVATSNTYSDLDGLPSINDLVPLQTSNTGKFLKTDGTSVSWATVTTGAGSLTGLSDVTLTSPSSGQVLKYDGSKWINGTDNTGGGGGGGLVSRSTASATTATLANNGTDSNQNIVGFKTYALLKLSTSAASWVRLYTDNASRTADLSRPSGNDPAAGAGVIAEIITTGSQTVIISPGTLGFNNETSPTTSIPITVTNLSGGSITITVTATLVQLEA